MTRATIVEWTDATVQLKFDEKREVKYQVFREDEKHFLDVVSADDQPIHRLQLPDGMRLDKGSYEVLLRYVLLDLVAA